jgi:hypothetical protein
VRRFVFAAVALATLGLLAAGSTVEAGKGWCRVDPVVVIDGQTADIFIGSDSSALTTTTGPIKIVVTVPSTSQATHVISDAGFGRGYDFRIAKSSTLESTATDTPVRIEVYVPATSSALPISVFFSPRILTILTPASADGHANNWVRLNTRA